MKALTIAKESTSIILTALMFTVLPILVFTLISRTNLLPGFHSYTVLTGSMSPLIPVGSVVYVYKSDAYSYGDIISFERGKINVTHRIVGISKKDGQTFYQTKGDANGTSDNELVPANNITGELLFHFPYIGKFEAFIRTVPGFILFIGLPTIGFILSELWNIKKEIERETEKRVLRRIRGTYV